MIPLKIFQNDSLIHSAHLILKKQLNSFYLFSNIFLLKIFSHDKYFIDFIPVYTSVVKLIL
jgi:hypothetical protein